MDDQVVHICAVECRRVIRQVGNCIGRPVRRCVPIIRWRVNVPRGTTGIGGLETDDNQEKAETASVTEKSAALHIPNCARSQASDAIKKGLENRRALAAIRNACTAVANVEEKSPTARLAEALPAGKHDSRARRQHANKRS